MKHAAPTLKASDLLAQVAPDRAQKRDEHEAAQAQRRAEYRARFPLMAEMVDAFRADDAKPENQGDPFSVRPVYAKNAAGEEWGKEPDLGLAVDGDKLARLPEYEAFWRKSLGKRAETNATYRERMQRAIRPTRGNE